MKGNVVVHIPHSSTYFPHKDGFICSRETLSEQLRLLTDWFTDELFDSSNAEQIISPFSRVFCDVERFIDDSQEIMAQYGMGVLYEIADNGSEMRIVNKELKDKVLEEYYNVHHKNFTNAVEQQLIKHNQSIIVDGHSFPEKPHSREQDKDCFRPDICIGTDDFHTPKALTNLAVEFFKEKAYSVAVNSPFSGTIVPMKYYLKDKRVLSIMIEVNRKLYMNEIKSTKYSNFKIVKSHIQEFLIKVADTYLNF